MIKAQRTLYGNIESINLKEELDKTWDILNTRDYKTFEKRVYFWIHGISFGINEIRDAKWFKKSPNYRPSGKPRYELVITTWDANGKNPLGERQQFETLAKLEKVIRDAKDLS